MMNCDEVRQHWELYHDSEGDSELYLQINEHLAGCPPCAKWLFQQSQLEELITTKLASGGPSPEMWQRVLNNARVVTLAPARGWAFFSPFLAVAATLLLAVGVWQWMPGTESEHLSALTAVVHRSFVEEGKPIEFASVSDQEVERYLKQRVSFAVRCPPRQDAGFAVRGGGVCPIAGGQAAYVVGQVADQDVSVFILPEERLAHFSHERDVLNREKVHRCREGDYDMVMATIDHNVVIVIGGSSPDQLEKVIRAYGTYPVARDADAA